MDLKTFIELTLAAVGTLGIFISAYIAIVLGTQSNRIGQQSLMLTKLLNEETAFPKLALNANTIVEMHHLFVVNNGTYGCKILSIEGNTWDGKELRKMWIQSLTQSEVADISPGIMFIYSLDPKIEINNSKSTSVQITCKDSFGHSYRLFFTSSDNQKFDLHHKEVILN